MSVSTWDANGKGGLCSILNFFSVLFSSPTREEEAKSKKKSSYIVIDIYKIEGVNKKKKM